jgi:hypothetical protein
MAQIFHPGANHLARISIALAILAGGAVLWAAYRIDQGAFITDVGVAREQPVQFSHKHHVTDDGIDCRYCHTSVETSPFAGMPSTDTCMTCHSQIWANAEVLEPVRASSRTGQSIEWVRIYDLPDFAYFDHSIHLHKGIGCSTCHGRVDRMPVVYKANTLHMEWCLDCHRAPERFVRPREEVFNMAYQAPADQPELGRRLVAAYNVRSLTDCNTCHR